MADRLLDDLLPEEGKDRKPSKYNVFRPVTDVHQVIDDATVTATVEAVTDVDMIPVIPNSYNEVYQTPHPEVIAFVEGENGLRQYLKSLEKKQEEVDKKDDIFKRLGKVDESKQAKPDYSDLLKPHGLVREEVALFKGDYEQWLKDVASHRQTKAVNFISNLLIRGYLEGNRRDGIIRDFYFPRNATRSDVAPNYQTLRHIAITAEKVSKIIGKDLTEYGLDFNPSKTAEMYAVGGKAASGIQLNSQVREALLFGIQRCSFAEDNIKLYGAVGIELKGGIEEGNPLFKALKSGRYKGKEITESQWRQVQNAINLGKRNHSSFSEKVQLAIINVCLEEKAEA